MVVRLLILSIFSLSQASFLAYCGSFQQENQFIIAFLTPVEETSMDQEEKQVIENDHLRNLGRLSDSGVLVNAWPIEGGSEVMILDVETEAQALSVLGSDPAIAARLLKTEILDLEIVHGGICKPNFPYEMGTFQMVRFSSSNQIATYKTNSDFEMRTANDTFLNDLKSTGEILFIGYFSLGEGGIVIHTEELPDSAIFENPALKTGDLKVESSKIWLNIGSLCEN